MKDEQEKGMQYYGEYSVTLSRAIRINLQGKIEKIRRNNGCRENGSFLFAFQFWSLHEH